MSENCVPYQRRALYLVLTVPMILLYIAIAVYLWTVHIAFFVLYGACFVLVAVLQGYICAYWQCPYIGKFAPCAGGFCLSSSQIARLFRNAKKSETTYNIVASFAFLSLLGIIALPLYFIYQLSVLLLLAYLGIVVVYSLSFLLLICPVCGTRYVCPGGKVAMRLRESITMKSSKE
jgi:hypothetical protein